MPHRTLAALVAWQAGAPSAAPGGVTLQYAPLSFDISFQEIFSTLSFGGTLCLVGDAERRDMAALLRLLDHERVEQAFLPRWPFTNWPKPRARWASPRGP
ncbi:hypothetical protein GCM10020254_80780 [Streptomyces goshikiensis]